MAKSFETIKKRLSVQHYFMNDSWLRDCLDYFLSEHPDANEVDVLSLIINQWLLSDLREINNERSHLPQNIQKHKLITLPGKYILQIEKAYDISTSKYKQLEKIRNVSTENIEATEVDKSQPIEPKCNRMMNLYLSDGVQDVIAMEYKPISSLGSIVPGYKVMIKGPVVCRRGVILLEEKNISMIGGEIENLLIENATENILARALNLPENPDPYSCIGKTDANSQNSSDDYMDIDFEAVANIEKLNETTKTLSVDDSLNTGSNKIPMVSMKKRDSTMLNELPVCFQQESQDTEDVVDDTDDEWIGMVDENNLDVVVAQSARTPDSQQQLQDFASDSEFCDFEMDTMTYDEISSRKSDNSSKSQNVQKSATSNSNLVSNNKSNVPPPISTSKNVSLTTAISRNHTPTKNPSKSLPKPSAQSLKIGTKQQTPKSKETNTKITDFITKTNPKIKQSSTSIQSHDLICDVKKIIPTKQVIYKTIRATTKTLQKLTKKDTSWYLEGSVTDGNDCIDVIFSSEVLEKLIGFTFIEFSQQKKLLRTNPNLKDKLRLTLRNTESALIKMDALLKLELIPNETKAKIICITQVNDSHTQR